MAIHLGRNARRVVRYGGITLATLFVFVMALQLSFPYDRTKQKIIDGLSEKYDVTIGDVERSWVPGRFSLKAVSLRTRPVKSDDLVTTFFIERLDVDLHFLPALHGTGTVDLDAKIGAGHIVGRVSTGKSGTSVHLDGTNLPSASLPIRTVLGLPMSGKINFNVAFDLPNATNKAGRRTADWSQAEGHIDLSCPSNCAIGDGKTKFKPKLKNARSQAMVAEGIEFGPVEIQSLVAAVDITPGPGDGKPGKLELTQFDLKSLDGELKIDFEMNLMPDVNESPVTGCLRFKPSDVLEKRVPITAAELTTTGALLGPDKLFNIKLTDRLRDMKTLPMTCEHDVPAPATTGGGPSVTRRPNLETPRPPPTVTVQPTPPPAPPPPPAPSTTGFVPGGVATPAGSAGSAGSAEGSSGAAQPEAGSAEGGSSAAGSGEAPAQPAIPQIP
jgi:type II secretion system protein N